MLDKIVPDLLLFSIRFSQKSINEQKVVSSHVVDKQNTVIRWVWPPPSNNGKWRFVGIPDPKNVMSSWWSRLHPGRFLHPSDSAIFFPKLRGGLGLSLNLWCFVELAEDSKAKSGSNSCVAGCRHCWSSLVCWLQEREMITVCLVNQNALPNVPPQIIRPYDQSLLTIGFP